MKKSQKNQFQIILLLLAAFALILAMFTITYDVDRFNTENELFISVISIFSICIVISYATLIIKRVNPKQYIYISFSRTNKEITDLVTKTLEEQFKKSPKYRFEILSADTIPYGANIQDTIQEYLKKSSIGIAIISGDYATGDLCRQELSEFLNMNKKIIPVIVDSCDSLLQLPNEISNIKALSLEDCKTEQDLEQKITILAKDIVRQRQNYNSFK